VEESRVIFGALIFIGLVIGANLVMYGVVRGATRTKRISFFEAMGNLFNSPGRKRDDSVEELRRRIADLNEGKKEAPPDSES
jgi:hypothetical protein